MPATTLPPLARPARRRGRAAPGRPGATAWQRSGVLDGLGLGDTAHAGRVSNGAVAGLLAGAAGGVLSGFGAVAGLIPGFGPVPAVGARGTVLLAAAATAVAAATVAAATTLITRPTADTGR